MYSEPITIQILDGKRGLPLERVHLQIVAGYNNYDLRQGFWSEETITDGQGRAMLADSLKDFGFVAVWVVRHKLCAAHDRSPRLSLGTIRNEGLSTPDECGTIVPPETPGVLIVFAKAHGKDLRPAPASDRANASALAVLNPLILAARQPGAAAAESPLAPAVFPRSMGTASNPSSFPAASPTFPTANPPAAAAGKQQVPPATAKPVLAPATKQAPPPAVQSSAAHPAKPVSNAPGSSSSGGSIKTR